MNLTTKQQALMQNPKVKMLIEALDTEVISNQTMKMNSAVSMRVESWLSCAHTAPQALRTTPTTLAGIHQNTIVDPRASNEATEACRKTEENRKIETERMLVKMYGARPWKFPLSKAPF